MADEDDMAEFNPFRDPAVIEASRPRPSGRYGADESGYNDVPPQISGRTEQGGQRGGNMDFDQGYSSRPQHVDYNRNDARPQTYQSERDKQFSASQQFAPSGSRENNFPPFPKSVPLKPCFYINIEEEIPQNLIMLCKYLLWYSYAYWIMLFINIFLMLAGEICGGPNGISGIIVSIIIFIIVVPTSFLFVFRSGYVCLKNNSSFYFYLFFASIGCQMIFHFCQLLGASNLSWAGLMNGAALLDAKYVFAGSLFLISGILYVGFFAASIYLVTRFYRVYVSSGANWQEAQSEFTRRAFMTTGQHAVNSMTSTNTRVPCQH